MVARPQLQAKRRWRQARRTRPRRPQRRGLQASRRRAQRPRQRGQQASRRRRARRSGGEDGRGADNDGLEGRDGEDGSGADGGELEGRDSEDGRRDGDGLEGRGSEDDRFVSVASSSPTKCPAVCSSPWALSAAR